MSVNAGDTYLIGESIEGLADVAAARHDFETATQLWAAALRLIAETDSVPWDPEGTEEGKTKAHSALGPERFDALWRRGQSMTEKDAVANAMNIALSPAGPERATTA